MSQRDEVTRDGVVIAWRQWPSTVDGEITVFDGETTATRQMTATERQHLSERLTADSITTNEASIRGKVDTALDGLRTIAATSGTLSGANLSNAVRLLARVQVGLIRLQLSKLDDASDT
jgi:hypothetical protein